RQVDRFRMLYLFRSEVALGVLVEHFGENEQTVQGGTQLVRHVRQKVALIFRGQLQLFSLIVEFGILLLQFRSKRLGSFEKILRPHGGRNRVEHDTEQFRKLIEERLVYFTEKLEGREGDHGFHVLFEKHRKHDGVGRFGFGKPHAYSPSVPRKIIHDELPSVHCTLTDQRLSQPEPGRKIPASRKRRHKRKRFVGVLRVIVGVEDSLMCADQRCQLR